MHGWSAEPLIWAVRGSRRIGTSCAGVGSENGSVGLLPPDRLYDYLDAVAASGRRRLWLDVRTPELLRTTNNRTQAKRQAGYLKAAQAQIQTQMRQQRRRAFRGDVSVELDIYAMGLPNPPTAAKSIKRYLDAMSKLVYRDDEQVAQLAVHRLADDHPRWRNHPAKRNADLRAASNRLPSALITVLPLRLYVADYDRAFRLHDAIARDCDYDYRDEGQELWSNDWNYGDDHRLDELRENRRDAELRRGAYAIMDDELAVRLSHHRERQIAEIETKLILHRRPEAEDRPGTQREWELDPAICEHLDMHFAAPVWMERYDMPGEFWLPLPPEVRGGVAWRDTVRQEMVKHRERWRMLPSAFDGELALDIAVLGGGGNARDVDNLAHDVLSAFEELYCLGHRGTVTGYRVYRCPAETSGVRVRAMAGNRIRQLADALAAAREYVTSVGPRDR